jgi:hypothetical protein
VHITRLSIQNLIRIGALEFEPGAVTEITGRNGEGNSSVLEALQIGFSARGLRSHPIREGEDCAMIVVELDNGMVIERRLREGKGGDLRVTQGRATLTKPQGLLNELFGSSLLFNPVEFLELDAKAQTKLLLDLVDLDLPAEELRVLGDGKLPVEYHPDLHPLKALKLVEEELSNQRTEIGRQVKQHKGAAEEARAKVPDGFGSADALAASEMSVTEINRTLLAARENNAQRRRALSVVAEMDRDIANLEELLAEARTKREAAVAEVESRPEQDESTPETQLAQYDAQQDALRAYDEAGEQQEAAEASQAEWDRLSGLIEAVRAKPAELLAAAAPPVEGMGLGEDGLVTIHGRALGDFSDSEREELAVTIAEALAGELRVVCVDGLEKFDPERRAALLARLQADGMQVFVTEVTDGPLAINGVPVEQEVG